MRLIRSMIAVVLFAAAAFAASPLFNGSTESKWSVASGGKPAGTITLLTSAKAARAEWKNSSKSPAAVYLGANGNIWLRVTGGDVELATISNATPENMSVVALLLPFDATDRQLTLTSGKVATYSYRGGKATYTYDAKGPSSIDVTFGGHTYTLTRTSFGSSNADASNFAIRPKKGAASRLTALSGSLLGPSDASVSAGAAGRGAGEKGLKLKDGGDYDAVLKLENRDANWRAKLDDALVQFQQEGKVGKDRENQ
ncbi:MAG: hypothetical protein QOI98_3686 [Solirubrobacteraceae bacterium]|nr:hypothetical protein [Solirubrobacteraceae bacterium]